MLSHPVPGILGGKMPSSIDIVFQEMNEWKSKGNFSVSAPKNSVDIMSCADPVACTFYYSTSSLNSKNATQSETTTLYIMGVWVVFSCMGKM